MHRGTPTSMTTYYSGGLLNMGGSWANTPGNGSMGGRTGRAYQELREGCRARALAGEGCWVCKGAIDLGLPSNHRGAFTMHHLDEIMHGGSPVCDPDRVAPAHRGCNSAAGLRAQNARRAARRAAHMPTNHATPTPKPHNHTQQARALRKEPTPKPAALQPGGSFHNRRTRRSSL